MLTSIWRDLVYAGRSLAKARAFTLVCVVSLGIGMVPVIVIPYFSQITRTPPPGVKPEGMVEIVTPPVGARGTCARQLPELMLRVGSTDKAKPRFRLRQGSRPSRWT